MRLWPCRVSTTWVEDDSFECHCSHTTLYNVLNRVATCTVIPCMFCAGKENWLCELHCIFILLEKRKITDPQICNVVDTIIVPEFKNSLGSTPIVINNACRAGEKIQSFVTNITCLHSPRRTHMRYHCILPAVGENYKVMTIASI